MLSAYAIIKSGNILVHYYEQGILLNYNVCTVMYRNKSIFKVQRAKKPPPKIDTSVMWFFFSVGINYSDALLPFFLYTGPVSQLCNSDYYISMQSSWLNRLLRDMRVPFKSTCIYIVHHSLYHLQHDHSFCVDNW